MLLMMPPPTSLTTLMPVVAASCAALATTMLVIEKQKRPRRMRRSRQTPKYRRIALVRPLSTTETTGWRRLLSAGCDDDFLLTLNMTRSMFFERLLPHYVSERNALHYGSPYSNGPKIRGRRATVTSADLLGMALFYLKSSGTIYTMCPFFGLVQTSMSVWLDYALEVLMRTVKKPDRTDFEVRWPTVDEMKASASLLEQNRVHGQLLRGVFAVTDGGRFKCADYIDADTQNAYYEGYTQSVEVTNLFVWNFFGEIIHAGINYPGCWHDTKLAGVSGLYHDKLCDSKTPPGMAILGDSAFVNNTNVTNGKVVRARKAGENSDIPESASLAGVDIILQRIMPSERQSAEWGVRAIKGAFHRLKTVLPADSRKRKRLIRCCVHLFNFRTRFVGLNQIRTVYGRVQERTNNSFRD